MKTKNPKAMEDFVSLGDDKEEDDAIFKKLLEQAIHVVEKTTKRAIQYPFLEFIDPSSAQIKTMLEKSLDTEFSFLENISTKYLANEI